MNTLATIPESRKTTLDVNIPLHGHTDSEHDVGVLPAAVRGSRLSAHYDVR